MKWFRDSIFSISSRFSLKHADWPIYIPRCSLPKMKKAIWSLGQKTSFLRVEMMFQSISIFWWLSNSVTRKWRRVEQRKKLPTGHMFVVIFVAKNSISEALSRKLNKAPSHVEQLNYVLTLSLKFMKVSMEKKLYQDNAVVCSEKIWIMYVCFALHALTKRREKSFLF